MIKSLDELAESRDFDRARYGEKIVGLSRLILDIDEQEFRCRKPSGYAVDTGGLDESELRAAFDGLVSEIGTSIGERKVGAIYCRSSAPGEYPGSNESIPVLYDGGDPEQSWLSFRDAFQHVREQGGLKPVLLQNLIGEITSEEISVIRNVHEYNWPGLPGGKQPEDIKAEDIPEFQKATTEAVLEALEKGGIELPECGPEDPASYTEILLHVENGPFIDTITISGMRDLRHDNYCTESVLSSFRAGIIEEKGYSRNDHNEFLDESGNVALKKGTKVSISIRERETDYIIGQTNTAFVARSRDCLEPNMASIKRAWGLTSYLMGSNKESDLRPRSMIIEYFDPETCNIEETINLGQDFWQTCTPYYFQKHCEAFSVRKGEIELTEALVDKYPHEISREVLRIAEFYQAKLGVEIEIEGCMINEGLHILQITKSPLPEDVISHLSEVPKSNILYGTDFGRGSINHSGYIVIKEDDRFRTVTNVFDEQGTPYLVLGFDEDVTSENKFLYMATNSSIEGSFQQRKTHNRGDRMRLVRMSQHMEGIACQTTFDAAQNGRQGGMFYADPDSLMAGLEGYMEEIDGVKIIRDVCVEACREGMQIYRVY